MNKINHQILCILLDYIYITLGLFLNFLGDVDVQQHSFFEEYQDICVAKAGEDKDWTIGTELRQCMLNQPDIMEPDDFREILVDDSLRRLYVLDADVLVSLVCSDIEQ